jgi:amyloid beta precursor protein binding protein 1
VSLSELLEISDAMDINVDDSTLHSHIPWIVILLKVLEEWRATTGTDGPADYSAKKEFKKLVQSKNRGMEENFSEAYAQAHYAYTHPTVPAEVSAILKDPCCSNISANASSSAPGFWVAMRALRDFVEQHGALPLTGSIPDMTADSATYIALQHAYQKRAAADVAAVSARVSELVSEHGCTPLSAE